MMNAVAVQRTLNNWLFTEGGYRRLQRLLSLIAYRTEILSAHVFFSSLSLPPCAGVPITHFPF